LISNNLKILIISFAGLYKEVEKKDKSIKENCQAVSEAIGEVLMIAVVVIAFSSIAVTIFSDVATKSPHIPHADLESTRLYKNTVRISHVGGESINIEDMGIVINTRDNSFQFYMPNPEVEIKDSSGKKSTNPTFTLGDYIEINTEEENRILGINNSIDMCLIHIPSKQTILRVKL